MNSANNLNELKSEFFPSLTSRWVYDPVNILMTALSDPKQRAQLCCGQILDPQKLLDNKWVLFKLLSLLSLVMQQQMTNTEVFFFFLFHNMLFLFCYSSYLKDIYLSFFLSFLLFPGPLLFPPVSLFVSSFSFMLQIQCLLTSGYPIVLRQKNWLCLSFLCYWLRFSTPNSLLLIWILPRNCGTGLELWTNSLKVVLNSAWVHR